MIPPVSMTVSHLYENLEDIKSVTSLKSASEGVNYCDKRAKPLCRRPLDTPSSPLCVILLYKKFLVSNSEYWDTAFVGLGKVQSDGLEDANYHILLRTLFRSKNEG